MIRKQGYYRRGGKVFGPRGDFYTSPYTHPLFARILGDALAGYLSRLDGDGPLDLIELGAGEGILGKGVLDRLENRHPGIFAPRPIPGAWSLETPACRTESTAPSSPTNSSTRCPCTGCGCPNPN